MKTKTEAKRQAILDEATQAFRELGYEGTSMSEIRARVGGSKATLYNHFASKDELFFEVIARLCEDEFEAVLDSIDPKTADVGQSLRHFGERFLHFLYSPQVRANRRLAIAGSGRNELGRLMYERGVQRGQKLMSDFLRTAMTNGRLRQADPDIATLHLYALLESELMDRFLFQQLEDVSDEEIRVITRRAMAVFMVAYGPDSPLAT